MVTFRDGVAIAGMFLLFFGLAMMWLPLAPTVLGVLLIGASIWGHLNEPAPTPDPDEAAPRTGDESEPLE